MSSVNMRSFSVTLIIHRFISVNLVDCIRLRVLMFISKLIKCQTSSTDKQAAAPDLYVCVLLMFRVMLQVNP